MVLNNIDIYYIHIYIYCYILTRTQDIMIIQHTWTPVERHCCAKERPQSSGDLDPDSLALMRFI